MELDEKVTVVLVHPDESGNIGSVCRAMKVMGLTRLRIVTDKTYNPTLVKRFSVHAYDVYENAVFYQTIEEALSDTIFSGGFSRRKGKLRKYFSYAPESFAKKIFELPEGLCAMVFGNEERGLSDDELSACSAAVTIPSSPIFPSLNLAHAVQIATYSILRASGKIRKGKGALNRQDTIALTETITGNLKNIGFFAKGSPESLNQFLGDIFSRAGLSIREAERLKEVFHKIEYMKVKTGHGEKPTLDRKQARD